MPGNFLTIYWIQTKCILLLGEQVLKIFLCIKRVRLNWTFIVYDVHNTTYSSHGAPCPTRHLLLWLNTRVKVHISVWTILEYPKTHSSYLLDSGDTFLPLQRSLAKPYYAQLFSSNNFCLLSNAFTVGDSQSLWLIVDKWIRGYLFERIF